MRIYDNVAIDNPLGRLYNLLCELKSTAGGTKDVFCKVFSIKDKEFSSATIMTRYDELLELCNLGQEQLEKLNPKKIEKYKETLTGIRNALYSIEFGNGHFNGNLRYFRESLNREGLLQSLEHCADYLSDHSAETIITEQIILDLLNEINELEQYILSEKLDKSLKEILICQLELMRVSLFKYQYFGNQNMEDMLAITLGKLILNQDKVKNDEDKNVISKMFGIMAKINSIFSIRENGIKLMEGIINKITDGK